MATDYCTTADVQTRAQVYKSDILNGAGIGSVVSTAISDASERVRAIMAVAYQSAVIDAYGPGSYPPMIVALTATIAVRSLYTWVTTADSSRGTPDAVTSMDRDAELYTQVIQQGALVDTAGASVPSSGGARLTASGIPVTGVSALEWDALYAGGPRG